MKRHPYKPLGPCDCSSLLRPLAATVLGTLLLVASSAGWAQEDPFGSPDPNGAAKAPADGTSGGEKESEGGETDRLEELVAEETDPVVRTILEVTPTTPEQWIRDIRALLNLNRAEIAKEYLQEFLEVDPGAQELAELQSRFGSALFLRLANTPELQPAGQQVADAVLEAARQRITDASRLAARVDQLSDPESGRRRAAMRDLIEAGPPAAVPLIAALADEKRSSEHRGVRAALKALGKAAVDPMIAALESEAPALRSQVMEVLGSIESREAVPFVLRPALATPETQTGRKAREMLRHVLGEVPTRPEAIRFLRRRRDQYLAGRPPEASDEEGQVTLWIWDPARQIPRRQMLPAADASFVAATRMAEQLYGLAPGNAEFEQMYLATGLEAAKRLLGYERPLTAEAGPVFAQASTADVETLQQVAQLAMEHPMPGAGVAAIRLLGERNDVELLHSDEGRPALLARALRSMIPRIRAAAARAVISIDPTEPYPGSSYLPETLGRLARGGGGRRALVGNPYAVEAQQIAGFLQVLGFEADTRGSGREVALRAFAEPDYEFILIHDAIDRPRYRELIQLLRLDRRTAQLPVGVVARQKHQIAAKRFARADPLTLVLAPPQTQEDVKDDVQRLLEVSGRGQLSPNERIRAAGFALEALAKLAEKPESYGFYDLLSMDQQMVEVLNSPLLSAKAARLLGFLGTPAAQQALVRFASTHLQPLAARQAAAAAFETAVGRRGLLLTRDELLDQYEVYNASEFLDRQTQQVLGSLLDTIESPAQASASAQQDH